MVTSRNDTSLRNFETYNGRPSNYVTHIEDISHCHMNRIYQTQKQLSVRCSFSFLRPLRTLLVFSISGLVGSKHTKATYFSVGLLHSDDRNQITWVLLWVSHFLLQGNSASLQRDSNHWHQRGLWLSCDSTTPWSKTPNNPIKKGNNQSLNREKTTTKPFPSNHPFPTTCWNS